MSDGVNWSHGDRFKFIDKNGRLTYGTVLGVDGDKVYTILDGYPAGVKGCFRADSEYVTKVVEKKKGRKR